MKRLLGLVGASGFGREVLPLVRSQWTSESERELVFVDDRPPAPVVNGTRVLTWEAFAESPEAAEVVVAVGDPAVRKVLVQRCVERALTFMSVTAPTARRLDEIETGAGAILCDFSMITSNVVIGRHFHANIYSYVAHDCVIGDYVTLAPGAKVNGNVHVEDLAYVGTGAIIKQGRPDEPVVIGEGAVVGMGAVVTKSVPPGAVMVGNPARPLVPGRV